MDAMNSVTLIAADISRVHDNFLALLGRMGAAHLVRETQRAFEILDLQLSKTVTEAFVYDRAKE